MHSANDIFSSAAFAVEGLDTYDALRVHNFLLGGELDHFPTPMHEIDYDLIDGSFERLNEGRPISRTRLPGTTRAEISGREQYFRMFARKVTMPKARALA